MVILLPLFILLISMDNTLFFKKLSVIELPFFLFYILSHFSGNYFLSVPREIFLTFSQISTLISIQTRLIFILKEISTII